MTTPIPDPKCTHRWPAENPNEEHRCELDVGHAAARHSCWCGSEDPPAAVTSDVDELDAAIRAIHQPVVDQVYDYTTCGTCGRLEDWEVQAERANAIEEDRPVNEWWAYPCPTVRALDKHRKARS